MQATFFSWQGSKIIYCMEVLPDEKKIFSVFLSYVLLILSVPSAALAAEDNTSSCYIATTECPIEYTSYAATHISDYVLSLDENIMSYNNISVGSPFAFADSGADVYYFPVICDGSIKYLFRVYPDGDSFSAAITAFLADEIEMLAEYTSKNAPMYLNRVGTQIIASIGSNSYVLFEYPSDMSVADNEIEAASINDYPVIDTKTPIDIELNLQQMRNANKSISLDYAETQGSNCWCTAYCLAAIIRTRTSFTPTVIDLMTAALGNNPSTSTGFPWDERLRDIVGRYNLYPVLEYKTVEEWILRQEIDEGRPCIAAMDCGVAGQEHSIVLCGYNRTTWIIWNPWYDFYESYSATGSYVPTGYDADKYSYTPYMHAYYFN